VTLGVTKSISKTFFAGRRRPFALHRGIDPLLLKAGTIFEPMTWLIARGNNIMSFFVKRAGPFADPATRCLVNNALETSNRARHGMKNMGCGEAVKTNVKYATKSIGPRRVP